MFHAQQADHNGNIALWGITYLGTGLTVGISDLTLPQLYSDAGVSSRREETERNLCVTDDMGVTGLPTKEKLQALCSLQAKTKVANEEMRVLSDLYEKTGVVKE